MSVENKEPGKVVDLRAAVEARAREEAEKLGPPTEEEKSAGGPDDPRFVLECLENNERGDGILFAAIHRGKFVYVKSRDEKAKAWFFWSGHHWEIDKADFHHAAVEEVALKYLREAGRVSDEIATLKQELADVEQRADNCKDAEDVEGEKTARAKAERLASQIKRLGNKRKDLNRRVDRLRSLRGAKNCLEYSHKIGRDGLFIYGDEVDQKPMLLPCKNGVIDLETGMLLDGNPADYLVRAIPVEYKGIDEPAPHWEKFIADIHCDDPALIEFIQRFFGYCLTGTDPEQMYACFIGEGANGKGTMFEVLREILGELSWSINPEMLLDSKQQKSPDGPSPSTMSLQGRRLVVASETDEGRKISAAQIKRYTGGDTLTGRNLFDKYDTNFQPTHKLVLYTNHAPRGLAADFALFRRLLYIEYPLRYVDDVKYHQQQDPQNVHIYRPKDGGLKQKLRAEKSGILAWLLRGCLKWQSPGDGGLKIPITIRAAVEEVRRKEDYLEQFLETVCQADHPGNCIAFSALYERFVKWYAETHGDGKRDDRYLPKKRKFGEQLRKKGYILPDPKTTSGKQYVSGITFEGSTYDDKFYWRDAPPGARGEDE